MAASIQLDDASWHTARVPSGASTGRREALEIRDHNSKFAEKIFGGFSVFQACENINEIVAPKLIGEDIDLPFVDSIVEKIDSTPDLSHLGANAALALSIAAAKAQAHAEGKTLARFFQPKGALNLPSPMVNILSGGAHAKNTMEIQDILVIANGSTKFSEAISWISAVREVAAKNGAKLGAPTHLTADEGGLAIPFSSIEEACEFMETCIEDAGFQTGKDISLAIDFAASQFFEDGVYTLKKMRREFTRDQFVSYVKNLVRNQPIISIEDPFSEDDWNSWITFTNEINFPIQIIGDDLYTTNLQRLKYGVEAHASNAILIKPNQNGLVTRTMQVLETAKSNDFGTVVSARSGETEDSWLSDFAVGWNAGQIKVGSTHGADRTAKWNRLLELENTEFCEFTNPFKG